MQTNKICFLKLPIRLTQIRVIKTALNKKLSNRQNLIFNLFIKERLHKV